MLDSNHNANLHSSSKFALWHRILKGHGLKTGIRYSKNAMGAHRQGGLFLKMKESQNLEKKIRSEVFPPNYL